MHELQQILLQKLPRLGELTFGCEVIVKRYDHFGYLDEGTYGRVVKDLRGDHLSMLVDAGDQLEFYVNWDEKVEIEILGHPFSHSHILEVLGEDWAMLSNGQLGMMDDNDYFVPCYSVGMRDVFYPKLPSNISDLSLPEYEETRKQLIQLLK